MSEEILKALMQLFAIIAKQDDGVDQYARDYVVRFLKEQLNSEAVKEFIRLFDEYIEKDKKKARKSKLTSVKDSVRTLGIAKKINKTLNQKQKVVVLVRLFEFIGEKSRLTDQREAIINTVAEVFNIPAEETADIQDFILFPERINPEERESFYIIPTKSSEAKVEVGYIADENVYFLHVKSVNIYFFYYNGSLELFLNGLPVHPHRIYLFANGSTLKIPNIKPVYYSDVVAYFLKEKDHIEIVFDVEHVTYVFPTGDVGLHDITFSEKNGKLVGILGASGSGKTTLLNVLSGIYKPTTGKVTINGIDLHHESEGALKGVIGLVPQDDLLIEELTVFENLYYNAKLCFKDKSDEELTELVNKQLDNLGLFEIKDLKVGSPFNKFISGGQRKRLNIALELIREPHILFLDEPTSGLSSRDSENVMSLLRELTLKGKLIFVVIHQPSSYIFKMFDNVLIMDVGGYMVYYGNPIESVIYFKTADNQVNNLMGECPTCGNVNPELIFNILDAKVVDEFGNYTKQRKVSPQEWYERFKKKISLPKYDVPKTKQKLNTYLKLPSWVKQTIVYLTRDLKAKLADKQYMLLNLFEAPLLAFILTVTIFYIADPASHVYIFRENENIPIYIFMAIIVAHFLGMTISADEIFKDRKLLLREKFLNLSRFSYLMSKVIILFGFSAIQMLTFVLIGNYILGIRGLYWEYWLVLFSMAAFSNMLGLNISASFNSVVTIYILIPLLMIPQMILGGAMFSFDKLNRLLTRPDKVPIIADLMATRWAYEALMVTQFKDNKFEKKFYPLEKEESVYNFKQVYYIPKLQESLDFYAENLNTKNSDTLKLLNETKALILHELRLLQKDKYTKPKCADCVKKWEKDKISFDDINETYEYFNQLETYYSNRFLVANLKKEKVIEYLLNKNRDAYYKLKDDYYNESVGEIVKKVFEKNKIIQYHDRLVQQVDPIYEDPVVEGFFDYRAHFYAPKKHFAGKFFDTFKFNTVVIWLMTLILFLTLYFDVWKKIMNIKYFKSKKND